MVRIPGTEKTLTAKKDGEDDEKDNDDDDDDDDDDDGMTLGAMDTPQVSWEVGKPARNSWGQTGIITPWDTPERRTRRGGSHC